MVVILPRVIRRSNPSRCRIGRLYIFFIRHSPLEQVSLARDIESARDVCQSSDRGNREAGLVDFRRLRCRAGSPARQTSRGECTYGFSNRRSGNRRNCNSIASDPAQQSKSTQNRPPIHLPHLASLLPEQVSLNKTLSPLGDVCQSSDRGS
jgi:hypothetical protein